MVTDYWDGVLAGVADFEGSAHHYERQFDVEADDCSETYSLWPVDQETLRLVLEDWAIWLRWDAAFRGGQTSLETHPALPVDRERHQQLKPELKRRIELAQLAVPILAKGEFRSRRSADEEPKRWGYEVQWTRVNAEQMRQ